MPGCGPHATQGIDAPVQPIGRAHPLIHFAVLGAIGVEPRIQQIGARRIALRHAPSHAQAGWIGAGAAGPQPTAHRSPYLASQVLQHPGFQLALLALLLSLLTLGRLAGQGQLVGRMDRTWLVALLGREVAGRQGADHSGLVAVGIAFAADRTLDQGLLLAPQLLGDRRRLLGLAARNVGLLIALGALEFLLALLGIALAVSGIALGFALLAFDIALAVLGGALRIALPLIHFTLGLALALGRFALLAFGLALAFQGLALRFFPLALDRRCHTATGPQAIVDLALNLVAAPKVNHDALMQFSLLAVIGTAAMLVAEATGRRTQVVGLAVQCRALVMFSAG